MPYKISEDNGKFLVVNADTGEVVGRHSTKEKAQAQLRALYANVSDAGKALDMSYAYRIVETPPDLAVKAIGRDEVRGYLTLWGDPGKLDLDAEYFTKSTDFWDGALGLPRPLTWEHGQDAELKAPVTVGQIREFGDDDMGRWYVAQLDRAHKYRSMISRLIDAGQLGTSSDSAPQYVQREQRGKGTWLKQWPLFAASLTTAPCEPRMVGTVDYFKSIGIDLPNAEAAQFEGPRMASEIARLKLQLLRLRG